MSFKFWENDDGSGELVPATKWETFVHSTLTNFGYWCLSIVILALVLYGGYLIGAPIFNPGKPGFAP